jgi:hypothetical protein
MKIQSMAPESLTPYELNAKIHDPAQVKRIAESLKLGWDQPIVVDKNLVIIKGHGRRLAAIHLGLKEVPVLVRDDLTEEQVRAARLADNRVAISNLDIDILKAELAQFDNSLLDGIFDKKELDFVVADLGELDTSAFVDNLDEEIAKQADETKATVAAAADKAVKIDKALGFKTIKGADERAVVTAMALIEEETKMTGVDAFVRFCRVMAGMELA